MKMLSGGRSEIVRGEVVELSPTGDVHGYVEGRVYGVLLKADEERGLGTAFVGEVGVVVNASPLTVRGADAALMLAQQMPYQTSPEGYLLTPPALVVEVLSPDDRASDVQVKVQEYLRAGVRIVWVVDPQTLTVTIYQQDGRARVLQATDELIAPGVLENLSVTVRKLFPKS